MFSSTCPVKVGNAYKFSTNILCKFVIVLHIPVYFLGLDIH